MLCVMLTDPEKVLVLWAGQLEPPMFTGPVLPVTMMLPSSDRAHSVTALPPPGGREIPRNRTAAQPQAATGSDRHSIGDAAAGAHTDRLTRLDRVRPVTAPVMHDVLKPTLMSTLPVAVLSSVVSVGVKVTLTVWPLPGASTVPVEGA